jgi:SAM-dependent methyltransferase
MSIINLAASWIKSCHFLDCPTINPLPFSQDWLSRFSKVELEQLLFKLLAFEDLELPHQIQDWMSMALRLNVLAKEITTQELCDSAYNSNILTKSGMSFKKYHEVVNLFGVINRVASQNNIDTIIDLGCGKGYLSHHLSHFYTVVAIDANSTLLQNAKRRGLRFASRKTPILYLDAFVTCQNMDQLMAKIYKHSSGRILITGLHGCGDLSGKTMQHWFKNIDAIKAIVSVGCCYHHIDLADFPLSCQFGEIKGCFTRFKMKQATFSFESFDKVQIKSKWNELIEKNKLDNQSECNPATEKLIMLVFTLKLIGSNAMEFVISLDRYMSLSDYSPRLYQIFDSKISARNKCLVATKL